MECDFRNSDIDLDWLDDILLQKKRKKENKSDNMLKQSCQNLDHICCPWLIKSQWVSTVAFLSHRVQNMGSFPEAACWFKSIIIISSIVTHILKSGNTWESVQSDSLCGCPHMSFCQECTSLQALWYHSWFCPYCATNDLCLDLSHSITSFLSWGDRENLFITNGAWRLSRLRSVMG